MTGGQGRKVSPAQLEFDRGSVQTFAPQLVAHLLRLLAQRLLQAGIVGDVFSKSCLLADGLGLVLGHYRPLVEAFGMAG